MTWSGWRMGSGGVGSVCWCGCGGGDVGLIMPTLT